MKMLLALVIATTALAGPALASDASQAGIPQVLQHQEIKVAGVSGFTGINEGMAVAGFAGDVSEGGVPAVLRQGANPDGFAFTGIRERASGQAPMIATGDVSEGGIPAVLR